MRFQEWFMTPLRTFPCFFLFLILTSNAICFIGNANGVFSDEFLTFLLSFFDYYLLTLAAFALKRLRLSYAVIIPVACVLVAEVFTIYFCNSMFGVYVVQLISETNTKESSEFLASALKSSAVWKTALAVVGTYAVSYFVVKCGRKLSRARRLATYTRWMGTLLFLLIIWSGIRQISGYKKLADCFSAMTMTECSDPVHIPHLNTTFVRIAYGTAFNMAASSELSLLAKTVEETTVESCSMDSRQIVLIIGESYNKHHTRLYESEYLNTTPLLEEWKNRGNLVVFNDAVTPFNVTSNAIKYMFSTWDEECTDDWTRHSLFPAVFRKAGYDVHFITNQFPLSAKDLWGFLGGTIFNDKTLSDSQFTSRNSRVYLTDMELLCELPSQETLREHPNLLIVHLNGQHVGYSERYPSDWEHFKASDEHTPFGGSQGKSVAAHYDNAVLYNDAVVDSVLRMFVNEDAVCIYLADHGEEVYDWRDKYERTQETPIPKEVLRYQYEIPLMFWMSDKYKTKHPELTAQIQQASSRRFISTDLCHTLFYLAGIKTKEYQRKKCIVSPEYDNNRKRIIRNETDYDEAMAQ